MFDIVKTTAAAVQNQGYEPAYIPQIIPVLGALASIPTALISGIHATVKIAQAIFQHFNEGKAFFRPKDVKNQKFPLEAAKDLAVIFVNNVVNICTLGIFNCILVSKALNQIVINKGID